MASGYLKVSDSESETEFESRDYVKQARSPLHWLRNTGNIFYIILIVSNIFFAGLWIRDRQDDQCIRPKLVYSLPGEEGAIRYEKRRLYRSIEDDNPFAGKPRPEHDAAWNRLIEPLVITISADELTHLGDKSIRLRDKTSYIVEPAIYHELHCIKRVRRHLYPDYYYPNMTEDEKQREGPHIDHCLEYWREAAMCRADMSMSTFYWNSTSTFPASRVYSDHECVNWDRLDAWSRSRMFVINDKHDLQDPSEYGK